MNAVREINKINQRELELGLAGKGSWHDEYKDSAYVFVGGLSYELTEGDVITIFSQWGEIVNINLPRDKVTGKTKGFGFVMYEDQRSTIMAVDNMNGAQILGRTVRVDHCRQYNQPGSKNAEGEHVAPEEPTYNAMPPILEGSDDSDSSESEAGDSLDEEDPMAAFLRAEKKKEKAKAKGITDGKGKKRKHEGESKEERRARKEAKRAKRAAKEAKKAGKSLRIKEEREDPDDRRRESRSSRDENGHASIGRPRLDRDTRYDGAEREPRTDRDARNRATERYDRGNRETRDVREEQNGRSHDDRDSRRDNGTRAQDFDDRRREDVSGRRQDERPRDDRYSHPEARDRDQRNGRDDYNQDRRRH